MVLLIKNALLMDDKNIHIRSIRNLYNIWVYAYVEIKISKLLCGDVIQYLGDNLSIYYAWHDKFPDMVNDLPLPVPSGMKQVREKFIDLLN